LISSFLLKKEKVFWAKKVIHVAVFEFSNPLRIRGSPIWGIGPYHVCYIFWNRGEGTPEYLPSMLVSLRKY
jgi:hypothetical protein